MANKEVYRLSIGINVTGDSQAKKKISSLESATEKAEKKMKKLDKTNISPTAKLNDKASSTIDKLQNKANKFKSAKMTATASIKDNATSGLEKIQSKAEKLDKTESKVKIKAEDQATSVINKAQSKLSGWLKSGAKKVISIGLAGTMLVGGLGLKDTMQTFTEFEKGLSSVQAITDATDADMQKLKQTALDLGASTAWSASNVTQAEELLGQAGYSTQENIAALPGLLSLASAGSLDLATATDIAVSSMKAFNLDASKAGHVADVLSLSANATNSDVTDLGEAMKYIAPVANSLGISIEDTASAVGLLSNAGIKGSQAGTVLRQTLNRLASPTDTASEMIEKYGIKAFDAQGNMKSLGEVVNILNNSLSDLNSQQKADVISTIFGTESMSGVLALMNQGGIAVTELTKRLEEADGAAQKVADTKLDNLAGQMENLGGAVETMKINLGDRLAPYAKQFVTWVTDKIPVLEDKVVSIVDYISKHTEDIKSMALAITGVVGAIAGLNVAGSIGNSISGISKFVSVIKGAGAATETTKIAGGLSKIGIVSKALPMLLNPVTIAVGATIATVSAMAIANNNLLKKSIGTVTEDLTPLQRVMNVFNGHIYKSKSEMQSLGLVYEDFGDSISDNFKNKVEESTKSIREFQLFINKINLDGTISATESAEFDNRIDNMVSSAISTIEDKKKESQEALSGLFSEDGIVSDYEQKTLEYIGSSYDNRIKQEEDLKKNIYDIKSKAIDEKRELYATEIAMIKEHQSEISRIELEAVGGTTDEINYAKNKFKARAATVDIHDASELMKESAGTRDSNVVEIKARYDTQIDKLNSEISSATDQEVITSLTKSLEELEKARADKIQEQIDLYDTNLKTLYSMNPNLDGKLNQYTGEELSGKDIKAQNKLNNIIQEHSGVAGIKESGVYSLVNDVTGNLDAISIKVDETTGQITSMYGVYTKECGAYTDELRKNASETLTEQEKSVGGILQSLSNQHAVLDTTQNVIKDYAGNSIANLDNVTVAADGTRTGITTINNTPLEIKTNALGVIESITLVNKTLDAINGKTVSATVNITQSSSIQQLNQEKLEIRKKQRGYASGTDYATSGIHEVAEHGVELVVGRQARSFKGGEKVLNNGETKSFFKGLGQTQVFQPQVQVAGGGGNQFSFNMGNINIQNSEDKEQIIQQACQEFARQFKEALFNTK